MGGCEIDLRQASIAPGPTPSSTSSRSGAASRSRCRTTGRSTRASCRSWAASRTRRARRSRPTDKRLVIRGIVVMGGVVGQERAQSRRMHPILARPGAARGSTRHLAAARRAARGAARAAGRVRLDDAALVAVPLSVCYGFLSLSAWYVTGGSPVDRVGAVRVGVTAVAASFLSSAVWLLLARGWMGLIAVARPRGPTCPAAFRAAAPTLFGFGFLLYLLAMAVSYLAAAFAVVARRGAAGAGAAGAGARSRAPRAARADRSAFPVQQPAVDQRADHRRSGRRRGGCACCSPTSCATRWRSARASGSRWRASWRWSARFLADRAGALRRASAVDIDAADAERLRGAAAAAAAARRERRHAWHRAHARRRHRAHPRRASRGVAGRRSITRATRTAGRPRARASACANVRERLRECLRRRRRPAGAEERGRALRRCGRAAGRSRMRRSGHDDACAS